MPPLFTYEDPDSARGGCHFIRSYPCRPYILYAYQLVYRFSPLLWGGAYSLMRPSDTGTGIGVHTLPLLAQVLCVYASVQRRIGADVCVRFLAYARKDESTRIVCVCG